MAFVHCESCPVQAHGVYATLRALGWTVKEYWESALQLAEAWRCPSCSGSHR